MKFASALLFLSCLAVSGSASLFTVWNDLAYVSLAIDSLDFAIHIFRNPGGTLSQAFDIHNDAIRVDRSLQNTIADIKALSPSPVSESDGRVILKQLEAMEPSINRTLSNLQTKKAVFKAISFRGLTQLILEDLVSLNASTVSLEHALWNASPTDLHAEAKALGRRIDAAFAKAIATYLS